jgi:hypothetical protein
MLPEEPTTMLLLLQVVAAAWQSGSPDSLAVLKSARRAQGAFEFTRRFHLPERYSGSNGGRYQLIGRIRYWYENGVDEDSAPPEPVQIREARMRLLAALDVAAGTLPGDEWILGQRVRYLLEDSQPQAAIRAAEQCRSVHSWCEALQGLVEHTRGNFATAESLFSAALADMPEDERCRWTDVSALLDHDLAARYRAFDCSSRAAFENRWWWLARPLYSMVGNDRRTEHFARQTMVRIEQGRRTPFGLDWGDDLRDGWLRFGWPTWWTREPPTAAVTIQWEPNVTGHDPSPAFQFTPSVRAYDHPTETKPQDWNPDPPEGRERYAPPYAKTFEYLDHQLARFRHGDSCVVVAAYDLSKDTLMAHQSGRAALVLARSERDVVISDHHVPLDGPDVLAATAPCEPHLLSLEVAVPARRVVARARYGIALDTHAAISDLLLLERSDSLPTELTAALPHMLATTRVRADHPVGLYWEVEGLAATGEEVKTSVTVTRRGTGWLRRAMEAVGLAGPRHGVSLEWEEILVPRFETPTVAGRALALDLASLSPGPYRIEVTVTATGRGPVTMRRDIELVRP